jgi:hypothetical protein
VDLEALKAEWTVLQGKLEAGARRQERLAGELSRLRGQGFVRREVWKSLPELLLNAVALAWLGGFVAAHLGEPRFAIPALALQAFALFTAATSLRHLVRFRAIDWAAPVVANQRQVEELRRGQSRVLQVTILLAPLLWLPLLIVVVKGLFGGNIYRLPAAWLWGNLLFGVAFIPLGLWAARRWRRLAAGRPWLARLANDVAGRNVSAAAAYLEELARFERDEGERESE